MNIKKNLVILCLVLISFGIGYIFWKEEIKYLTPTPLPAQYNPPKISTLIKHENLEPTTNKPLFIHFFNPDCPCSRFNIKHFNSLVKKYNDKIEFKAVIPSNTSIDNAIKILPENINLIKDTNNELSTACGVYSTPQAVLLTPDQKLYFRGNYNKARYCTQKNSNYAELAIADLLSHKTPKDFGSLATTAYGCEFNKQ